MNKFNFKSLVLVLLALVSRQALLGAESAERFDIKVDSVVAVFLRRVPAMINIEFIDEFTTFVESKGCTFDPYKVRNFSNELIAKKLSRLSELISEPSRKILKEKSFLYSVFEPGCKVENKDLFLTSVFKIIKLKFKECDFNALIKQKIVQGILGILNDFMNKEVDKDGKMGRFFIERRGKIAFKPNESASRDSARVKPPKPGRRKPISTVPSAALFAEAPPASVYADSEPELLELQPDGSLVNFNSKDLYTAPSEMQGALATAESSDPVALNSAIPGSLGISCPERDPVVGGNTHMEAVD